ncbi:class I SAM-dependent methyltransferase [bacterium]|nr:class I SAM-dependent methyltransferase [bacterium]MBU1959410.1 class I SAM-dependent methyltransferase [bacterium]
MATAEMENKTTNYYERNHKTLIKRYNLATLSSLNQLFNRYIKKEHKVLDIGFGSGRDLNYIRRLGAECWGVDACQGFIDNLAKDTYFKDRLFCAKLPILGLDMGFKFDVLVSIAVIMHLSKDEIKAWIEDVKNYLSIGGLVIVSYSTTARTNDERFFEDLRHGVVEQLFTENGFRLIDEICSFDGLQRDIAWRNQVYKL